MSQKDFGLPPVVSSTMPAAGRAGEEFVDGVPIALRIPGLPVIGTETGPLPAPLVNTAALPAVPTPPVQAPAKCITENCNCKPKDHGMCSRCLKDTIKYMEKDPKVTWKFLEANGLALPASGSGAGGKFLAGLTVKLNRLHNPIGESD